MGYVWIDDKWKDLGNRCYCVLWQLLWYRAKDPSLLERNRRLYVVTGMAACVERYESLADKWPHSEGSVKLKGDVIEYAAFLSRSSETSTGSRFLESLADWGRLYGEVMDIVAKAAREEYLLRDSLLPYPRDLAQLIGLSAVADQIPAKDLNRAFTHYGARWI